MVITEVILANPIIKFLPPTLSWRFSNNFQDLSLSGNGVCPASLSTQWYWLTPK
jgi:hypothetical protein